MANILDVHLHRELVGHLIQDDGGQMVFDYAPSWLENPHAVPQSHSLPLRSERFKRNACRGFFAGILPEESNRAIIARNLGISAQNDYAMLERIGGECAGAVTFVTKGGCPSDGQAEIEAALDQEAVAIPSGYNDMAGREGVPRWPFCWPYHTKSNATD
jgi:serine/threonine-protein kinase HipA